eukprot:16434078-Heterocapsa_arctica.AAC.2
MMTPARTALRTPTPKRRLKCGDSELLGSTTIPRCTRSHDERDRQHVARCRGRPQERTMHGPNYRGQHHHPCHSAV